MKRLVVPINDKSLKANSVKSCADNSLQVIAISNASESSLDSFQDESSLLRLKAAVLSLSGQKDLKCFEIKAQILSTKLAKIISALLFPVSVVAETVSWYLFDGWIPFHISNLVATPIESINALLTLPWFFIFAFAGAFFWVVSSALETHLGPEVELPKLL